MINMKNTLLALLLSCSFGASAQIGEWDTDDNYVPEINPKHAFNAEVRIPITVQNPAYKRMIKDMIDASVSYTYYFPFHMTVGAGFRMMYNVVNVTQVEPGLTGRLGTLGPYLKIGYEKFVSERMALEGAIRFGGVFNSFVTSKNKELNGSSYKNSSLYIEPNVSLILSASENTSFRLNIGYAIYGYKFKPYHLGSVSQGNWTADELNRNLQSLNIGFGFTYYFGQY